MAATPPRHALRALLESVEEVFSAVHLARWHWKAALRSASCTVIRLFGFKSSACIYNRYLNLLLADGSYMAAASGRDKTFSTGLLWTQRESAFAILGSDSVIVNVLLFKSNGLEALQQKLFG